MSQKFRISEGGRVDREQALSFEFNGKSYSGLKGDTLASALLANGIHMVGRSWKYHRPRGIVSAGDGIEFLLAGATTVGVGTALFYDPLVCQKINSGVAEYMERHGVGSVSELVGALQF